ncbi:MAG: glycosyltransferase [Thermotogae bacterium]|nr:glycosyltransferase [Thermotogota bacterium]
MKILIIGYMHTKNDKRVFRTVETLSKTNEIIYQYITENEENKYKEGNINYLPIKYTENKNLSSIEKLKMRYRNLDKVIFNIIKTESYDMLYMHHFLPSKPIKPFVNAKKMNKKVVYDLHELHPENFLENLTGFKKIIKEKIMWKILKKQIKFSDKVIFVSEEMSEYVHTKIKNPFKSKVITNYASIALEPEKKAKTISIVGKTSRSLESEIKIIKESIKNGFEFKIIGMDLIDFSDVEHTYTSFLPYEKMMKEISKSAFSIISYTIKGKEIPLNFVFSMPNKFFDSIASGTPVIVNEKFISMSKIVNEYSLGVTINPNNPEEAYKKIENSYNNYNEIIKNIKKYKEKFIWTAKKEKEFINFIFC